MVRMKLQMSDVRSQKSDSANTYLTSNVQLLFHHQLAAQPRVSGVVDDAAAGDVIAGLGGARLALGDGVGDAQREGIRAGARAKGDQQDSGTLPGPVQHPRPPDHGTA